MVALRVFLVHALQDIESPARHVTVPGPKDPRLGFQARMWRVVFESDEDPDLGQSRTYWGWSRAGWVRVRPSRNLTRCEAGLEQDPRLGYQTRMWLIQSRAGCFRVVAGAKKPHMMRNLTRGSGAGPTTEPSRQTVTVADLEPGGPSPSEINGSLYSTTADSCGAWRELDSDP
jgi:hypothetical protein